MVDKLTRAAPPVPAVLVVLAIIGAVAAAGLSGRSWGRAAEPVPLTAVDPASVYDPHRAGERLPPGYFPVLQRDFIQPIYEPRFVPAADVDWSDDTDVIGVALGEGAKAYPVSQLNFREIVNDELDGIPILVTW